MCSRTRLLGLLTFTNTGLRADGVQGWSPRRRLSISGLFGLVNRPAPATGQVQAVSTASRQYRRSALQARIRVMALASEVLGNLS